MQPRVLIAHGNTQSLRRAVQALQGLGFNVIATPDGGDAFARFFEGSPALVLCSVSLPSLSGPNFARMVRSQSPETPVVILKDTDPGSIADEDDDLIFVLNDPLDVNELRRAVPHLIPSPSEDDGFEDDGPSTAGVFILAALKRFQRSNNLLALLDEMGIHKMARIAQTQVHDDGSLIIRQGDIGDGFYFLVEGQVRVTLQEKNDAEVARINAGGFFGEMALLNDRPRSASVSTVGPCTLLWFERDAFMPLLEEYSVMREVLSGVADKRTEENLWRVLFDDTEVTRSLENIGSESSLADEIVIEEAHNPAKSVVEEMTRRVERNRDDDVALEMPPETAEVDEPPLPPEPEPPPPPPDAVRSDEPIAFEDDAVEASFEGSDREAAEIPPEPHSTHVYEEEPEPEITVALDEAVVVHQPQNPQELASHAGRVFEAHAETSEPVNGHSPWTAGDDEPEATPPATPPPEPAEVAAVAEVDVDVDDLEAEGAPLPPPVQDTVPRASSRRPLVSVSFLAGLIAGLAGGIVGSYFMIRSQLPPELLQGGGDGTTVTNEGSDHPTPSLPPPKAIDDGGPAASGDSRNADGGPSAGDENTGEVQDGDGSRSDETPKEPSDALEPDPLAPDPDSPEVDPDAPEEGSPASELTPENQEERRKLRRSMFYLAGQSKYAQAMRVGRKMQEAFPMDWESLLKLADMERLSGDADGAVETYTAFLSAYSTNLYVDDARLGKAQALITLKRYGEAKRLLKRVASGDDMERAVKANAILATIN